MINKKLKTAMFEQECTHKMAAEILEINTRVFTNKLNKRTVNGYAARFTASEKTMLALKFGINANEIE